MVPSLLVALYYNQSDKRAFLISIVITSIVGFIMSKSFENKKRHKGKRRTSHSCIWMDTNFFFLALCPFVFSGSISSWIDAFF